MKRLTQYIILFLLPLTGLMAQSCDTVKLKLVTSFDGPDISVDVVVENFKNIEGFQFSLNYDVDFMRLKLLSYSLPSFTSDNFTDNKSGSVRCFWLNGSSTSLDDGAALISMKFTPIEFSSTGFINISDSQLPLEFINDDLQTLCVDTDQKELKSDGYTISGVVAFDKMKNCTLDPEEKGLSG